MSETRSTLFSNILHDLLEFISSQHDHFLQKSRGISEDNNFNKCNILCLKKLIIWLIMVKIFSNNNSAGTYSCSVSAKLFQSKMRKKNI